MGLLEKVISKDQELTGHGRWLKGTVNDSLVVDTEKQVFFWNSKSLVGDVYVWLREIRGMSYEQAKEYLKQFNEFSGSFIHTIKDQKETVVYPKLVEIFYEEGLKEDQTYWTKRGITLETIHRFKLGFHNEYYMIPIYQDGLFRNFQMRQDTPAKKIRSYYKDVGPLLFNSDIMKITNSIIIAEGPTDCIRLMQEGVPCVSHNAGSEGWQNEWFKYFITQKEIYVVYDNDKAGREGAKRVARNLGIYRTKIYTFDGFDDKYDIVDFYVDGGNTPDLLTKIKNESKYLFELK